MVIVDGLEGRVFVDDMRDRPVQGTSDWNEYEIVVLRLRDAETVTLGVLLIGPGTAWLSGRLGRGKICHSALGQPCSVVANLPLEIAAHPRYRRQT